jgi:hypothetical protein
MGEVIADPLLRMNLINNISEILYLRENVDPFNEWVLSI